MVQMRRFKVDKLVRDKIPEILKEAGIKASVREMDQGEYAIRLKNKLLEEAAEEAEAIDPRHISSELADLLEVIHEIAHIHGFSFEEIQGLAQKKREEKGGFGKHLYCAFMDIPADSSKLDHYLSNPDRYPEISLLSD